MSNFNVKRPTTLFERALPWISVILLIGVGSIIGLAVAWAALQVSTSNPSGTLRTLTIALGIVVVVLSILTFFYSVRKRTLQEQMPGTMMAWLQSHVYLGILAFAVAFLHAWLPGFSAGISTGKITLGLFTLLVVSGTAWRIIYVTVPKQVAREVGNLSASDTRYKASVVRIEIDKLLAGTSAGFRQAAQQVLDGKSANVVEANMKADPADKFRWDRFKRLAARLDRYNHREGRQEFYAKFMQGWKLLHLPLAVIFGTMIVIHILDVTKVPNAIVGGPVRGLPSSNQCASCHAEIVEEWNVAMHSQAQTGPVVVSQTNLALEQYPEFGRACNNCHSPVGTAITGTSTLPVEGAAIRALPNGHVIDEGVTCIVCHTPTEPPEERRGMLDNFPVVEGTNAHYADMIGPPFSDPQALPNSAHNTGTGFMTDPVASSQLCSACHNVKVDIDGDGEITAFPGSEGNGQDSDGNGRLDENELQVDDDGKLLDLVLQTTYDEWEDYVAAQQAQNLPALGCIDCHMPALPNGPVVSAAPGSLLSPPPDRSRASHTFVGVDYNLTPGFYDQPDMPPDAFELVQHEREELLRSAATLDVSTRINSAGQLSAVVDMRSFLVAHNLPTGFAFARQMWLEVSAQTVSGQDVCLDTVDVNGQVVGSTCSSGTIQSPQAQLLTCDTEALAALGARVSKNNEVVRLNPASIAPLDECDPWLANFQKILSDGDADGDGIFEEVPYQSALADIVKVRVRVSDNQAMDALNMQLLVNGEPINEASFEYLFDISDFSGEQVVVTATLHFRHLPPYFIQALDDGYPDGLSASQLLENMTVVDMAEATSDPVDIP